MKAFLTIFVSLLFFSVAGAVSKPVIPPPNKIPENIQRILLNDKGIKLNDRKSLGGATSGGGDDVGLQAQRILGSISSMVEVDKDLYSDQAKQVFLLRSRTATIIVTDEQLPADASGLTQFGAAYSVFDGKDSVILIQRQRWASMDNLTKDSLIHHEVAVLAGLEATGDYRYTSEFTKRRAKLWERVRSNKFVCTFSLYEKGRHDDLAIAVMGAETAGKYIGKHLGSTGIGLNGTMTKSDFGVIYDLETQVDGKYNNAVIVRYVVSNDGYLRAMISEASVKRFKNDSWKVFSDLSKSSAETTYFSPYDLMDTGRVATLEEWDHYYLQVGCSKI